MPLIRTIASRAAPVLRGHTITQRASLNTGAPKGHVGALEVVVGLGMFSLAFLGPSGWILANLESYKNKE
ncbi:hypothetical protein GBF38_021799 [Nibea albiflora]|uniref:Uncharacterized protein n=1 Tax=Nibea albiflora TaxID=240163 RepID=A0ACB7FHV7_NIBAL|nr:hypothetical protein GBF38_021799 [Nibea albiflora]